MVKVVEEKLEVLKKVEIFSSLSEDELRKIASLVKEIEVPTGNFIVKEGEKGDALYIIKSGKVQVSKSELVVAKLGEGSFFGEMALIEQKPRTADVKAIVDTSLLKLSQDGFNFIIRSNPTILMKLVSLVTERVRKMAQTETKAGIEASKEKAEKPREATIISFFSSKGGVGKSVFLFQLAPYLSQLLPDKKILIWDLDLEFGSLDVLFNLKPTTTICDLVESDISAMTFEKVTNYLLEVPPKENIYFLSAPPSPEKSEIITMQDVRTLLLMFKKEFDYIFIDLPNSFTDTTITALDNSSHILFFSCKELTNIRNSIRCLKLMNSLSYPEGTIKVVLNGFSSSLNMDLEKIEAKLGNRIIVELPENRGIITQAINSSIFICENEKLFAPFKKQFITIIENILTDKDKEKLKSSFNDKKTREGGLFGPLKKIFGG